jgi:hypothetical protein
MLQIDQTIHLSDVALVGGGLWAFVKMFIGQRDINRQQAVTNSQIMRILGEREPRSARRGILGDIDELKERQGDHHEWLIRKGFGRRLDDQHLQDDGA